MAARTKTKRENILEPRDGPNAQFVQHHDITDRRGGGKRIYSKLEQLLSKGYITPEQSEAGRRFVYDHEKGWSSHGRSCLDFSGGRSASDRHPSMSHLDACRRCQDAADAVEEISGLPRMPGSKWAIDLIVTVCVTDKPINHVARACGVSEEAIKAWISQILSSLADHYARVDRISGRSTTAQTKEAALRRYEPELV